MGNVELAESNRLRVTFQSQGDVAARRAAMRSVPDPDEVDLFASAALLDSQHVDDVLAGWACGSEWSPDTRTRAIDGLAPYARRSSSIRAVGSLESNQRMVRKLKQAEGD
ncbi:MAG: hypothetical protein HZA52_01390 [Planctomycetes bacterium]|nr:hypothetical protein [Planctomycetota bacterium]